MKVLVLIKQVYKDRQSLGMLLLLLLLLLFIFYYDHQRGFLIITTNCYPLLSQQQYLSPLINNYYNYNNRYGNGFYNRLYEHDSIIENIGLKSEISYLLLTGLMSNGFGMFFWI